MKNKTSRVSFFFITAAVIFYLAAAQYLDSRFFAKRAAAPDANPIVALSLSMSRELRQVVASCVWLRIDEYFHSTGTPLRTNREIVPLLKLVTIFDGSFIDAYFILAHHLSFHLANHRPAVELLNEGIARNKSPLNPRISELYFEAGWILSMNLNDTAEAIFNLREGKKYLTDQCDYDNAHLALKLLDYLERTAKGESGIVKMAPRTYDKNASFKQLMNCEDEEKEGEHAGHDEEHESHLYFGQNPWHNPGAVKNLENSIVFYFSFFVIFLAFQTGAKFFKPGKKN